MTSSVISDTESNHHTVIDTQDIINADHDVAALDNVDLVPTIEPIQPINRTAHQHKKRGYSETVPEFYDIITYSRSGRATTVTAEKQRRDYIKQQASHKRKLSQQLHRQQTNNQPLHDSRWGDSHNCTVCEGTGDLLPCVGGCRRLYHVQCAADTVPFDDSDYTCNDCRQQKYQCYAPNCNQYGAAGVDVVKCHVDTCGKYYHLSCIQELPLTQFITNKSIHAKQFICPQHFCDACGDRESLHNPVIKCVRCPTAYHYNYKHSKLRDKNLCVPLDISNHDIFMGGYCICHKVLDGVSHTPLNTTGMSDDDIILANQLSQPRLLVNESSQYFRNVTYTPPGWYVEYQMSKQIMLDVEQLNNKHTKQLILSSIDKPIRMLPPPPYRKLQQNDWRYAGGKPIMRTDEIEICSCIYDPDNNRVCDEQCELRAMYIECTRWCKSGTSCQNQRLRNRQYASFKLFHTVDRGYGLISTDTIKRGALITEYCGEIIDEVECAHRLELTALTGNKNFYMMKLNKSLIIDALPAGNMARFINHSCQPNCHTEQWSVNGSTRVGIYASIDIPCGIELTYDYLCDTFGEIASEPCRCGAENCVGTLGGKKHDKHSNNHRNNKKIMKPRQHKSNVKQPVQTNIHSASESDHGGHITSSDNSSVIVAQLQPVDDKATTVQLKSINDSGNDSISGILAHVSTTVTCNGYVKQQINIIEHRVHAV